MIFSKFAPTYSTSLCNLFSIQYKIASTSIPLNNTDSYPLRSLPVAKYIKLSSQIQITDAKNQRINIAIQIKAPMIGVTNKSPIKLHKFLAQNAFVLSDPSIAI
jgi:hypothetical protein